MPATIEELHSDHDDVAGGSDNETGANLDKVQSRAERKARKALIGLGLKRVPDITRVTLRRPKGLLYVIATPDVFKSQNSDCYIVFGEAKMEDPNAQTQLGAQQLASGGEHKHHHDHDHDHDHDHAHGDDDDDVPELEEADDSGEVDETGVDPKDIELVMTQVNCSRAKAVKVLKENGGDLITAIMAASE